MTLRVAIIGAGIGGLANAAFLAKAGHDVVVLERSPTLEPVGAGLLLQPTGRAVLDRLGVGDRIASLGAPVDRLQGVTTSGRTVLSLAYTDLRPGLQGTGVHRGLLHSSLLEAATTAGARIRSGIGVDEVSDRSGVATLRMSDGQASGPYDLVVIASGARSTLRRFAGDVRRAQRYPWGALWFVANNPPQAFERVLGQVYQDTTTMLGFLPTGRLTTDGPETISVFWSLRTKDWAGPEAFELDAWKDRVRRLRPEAAPMFDQVERADQLIFAPYYDVHLAQRPGRVVAIGDAAHATSPQLGQGANLALLDAACLADKVANSAEIPHAVRRFARARKSPTRYYRVVSRWLTPWFQSDARWLTGPRDAFMGPLCAFPPTRRQMLLALAGVKRSWVSSRLADATGETKLH
ncbi:MAG: NAD(P)/FAD-dependent oxidoreductase [Planctomycetota bacterium]